NREGMARFGIKSETAFGVNIPVLRKMAREIGKDHTLALQLWEQPYHEAKLLATLVADPKQTDSLMMEKWVKDFYSWDICDQCCGNLFEDTALAYQKAQVWAAREEEFVRRAGFVMMARLAVSDKKAENQKFEEFLYLIKTYSTDSRNFVKKAVNWALRQIGKRNWALNEKALEAAKEIYSQDNKTAKWIAADAMRELENDQIRKRIKY
ncbi:MAG: DNA alkylation repair protein, partial [Bacteroidota bacterium]|nr:DNA alkylation repair protein [Bacteroidota bacterium]